MDIIRGYLTGRCRRPEYWAGVLVLIGLNWGSNQIPWTSLLFWPLLVAWFVLASRRLRDIGWSPWLCLIPAAALLAFLVVAAMATMQVIDDRLRSAAPIMLLLVWLGFWLLIGVRKSAPAAGPTPQTQAEVFG
ncbi:DUF805 domain-containing protein [Caulobacter hibisci]|uniref:DUF805 domain-containing protein n=1 Tax=Caulobacter hibisci TaxID=2035993 RepID=A0ABS0T1R9_9CAUL|nr:DUF805 domain-containing protein [Caulobacter hibisci]MBI1685832.1 DUF805 domain-containing protein [Caulobacter hibisci]